MDGAGNVDAWIGWKYFGMHSSGVNRLIRANMCNSLATAGQLSFGVVLGELVLTSRDDKSSLCFFT
jgi:hypothetical protein